MKKGVSRLHHHKVGNGVSTRWVSLFCIASFFFGVLVVNRLWAGIDRDEMDGDSTSMEIHQSVSLQSVVNCEKKEDTNEAGDIFSKVSQTHDVIRKLDKAISALEMQLAATRASKSDSNEGSLVLTKPGSESLKERKKVFFVMGIMTAFSSKKLRDSIRETWMPEGDDLKKLETEKGIIMRFVIGHSASSGGILDRAIDAEDEKHKDFIRLHIDEQSLCCGTPPDCEWKAQAGNPCAASFDWSCSGICKSVERMKEVHQRCGEGDDAIWHTSF